MIIGEPPTIYLHDFPGRVIELRLSALRRHELAHCNGWPADHRSAA